MSMRLWLGLMSSICLAAIAGSLLTGSTWIGVPDVFSGLAGKASDPVNAIIQSIRLPRALIAAIVGACLLYTSPSPRDATLSRMPSSA